MQLIDLSFTFGGGSGFTLGPLDITIRPGELTFWTGPNGSGKSTAARLIAGELSPSSGEIAPETRLIYYSQEIRENAFPELTLRQHFKLIGRNWRCAEQSTATRFPTLAPLMAKYPEELSGGQLQLFSFAQALAGAERYEGIILDEVLNHLDSQMKSSVLDSLLGFLRSCPTKYCVVVSHDEASRANYADRTFVFQNGHVVDELSRGGFARRTVEHPN